VNGKWVVEKKDCDGKCGGYSKGWTSNASKTRLKSEIENRVTGTKIFHMEFEKKNELTELLESFGVTKSMNSITDINLDKLSLKPKAHPDAIKGAKALKILHDMEERYKRKLTIESTKNDSRKIKREFTRPVSETKFKKVMKELVQMNLPDNQFKKIIGDIKKLYI
jgi:hypothetical protein